MSFIRSASNPETLYCFENGSSGNVEIWHDHGEMLVPKKIFYRLMNKCKKKNNGYIFNEKIEVDGFSISEGLNYRTSKLTMEWKGDRFLMYRVTWYYLYTGVVYGH